MAHSFFENISNLTQDDKKTEFVNNLKIIYIKLVIAIFGRVVWMCTDMVK